MKPGDKLRLKIKTSKGKNRSVTDSDVFGWINVEVLELVGEHKARVRTETGFVVVVNQNCLHELKAKNGLQT